jgi:acetyltransferase-like isoleucine patch superfamily enzyme
LGELLWQRRTTADFARGLVPPPPHAFAEFGLGSFIAPPARVLSPHLVHIGEDVMIHTHARLSVVELVPGVVPRLTIGDRCHIGRFATVACVGHITFEADVLTADRIFVGDSSHEYADPTRPVASQGMTAPAPVVIRRGAFLGVGCVVLPGVTVGENAYIGAGAVVTADVAARTLVVGNPARVIRYWDADRASWVAAGG